MADSLIDEMTQFEARLLLEMIHQNAIRIGGKDVFSKVHKMENARAHTNMTEEAIRAAEKNPFAKPFWLSVGLLVGVMALFVAAASRKNRPVKSKSPLHTTRETGTHRQSPLWIYSCMSPARCSSIYAISGLRRTSSPWVQYQARASRRPLSRGTKSVISAHWADTSSAYS